MTQTTNLGAVRAYQRSSHAVLLDCGNASLAVAVLTPQIVRVRLAPGGAFAPRRSWAVTPPDEEFAATPFEVEETAETLLIRTAALAVHIERATGCVSFVAGGAQRFCVDAEPMHWGKGVCCRKQMEAEEHFYGFGERTGLLDKRGRLLVNWTTDPPFGHGPGTDPLYIAIPVCMVARPGLSYGGFFNNTWRSRFDIGDTLPDVWQMQADGGELDYYVVYGPTPSDVSAGMGVLLGTMPLPPRWALGYHQSRWSYRNDAEVRALTQEFRSRALPCDAIHFDIDYMDGYRVFTWNGEHFHDLPALMADLRRNGFRAVTIIDPGVKVDPDYAVYQDGLARDMFIRRADGSVFHGYVWPDDAVFADFTRPEVRAWWADLHKTLVAQGVSGIWNDMNEPTVFERPFSQGGGSAGTIDLDAPQGAEDERSTHAEVHNLYGLLMSRACYEGMRRNLDGERPFVLTRSAFAGVQRWSACWMGDNNSWWEHMEIAMPQLMNMGLSGVPFVGVDIGGFFGNASGELFARWMQLGVLLPFCRSHTCSGTQPHEPWVFGPEVEAICRDYLALRYRLLPYIYSLFWEAHRQGTPVLRPLFYHFSDDPDAYTISDQVLLGPFLMAAPVYRPNGTYRHTYLPQGIWYDWWTGERIDVSDEAAHCLEYTPLERMPFYARAGAIIPSGPDMLHTGERALDPLTLDLFPGDGTFTLYEDDGISFGYERGEYCTTRYTLREQRAPGQPTQLQLSIGARAGNYTPPARQLVLRLHAGDIRASTSHPGATFNALEGILTLTLEDDGSERTIEFRM